MNKLHGKREVKIQGQEERIQMSQRETGMGEHDAKKWGRAPTRLHGITFQKTL